MFHYGKPLILSPFFQPNRLYLCQKDLLNPGLDVGPGAGPTDLTLGDVMEIYQGLMESLESRFPLSFSKLM